MGSNRAFGRNWLCLLVVSRSVLRASICTFSGPQEASLVWPQGPSGCIQRSGENFRDPYPVKSTGAKLATKEALPVHASWGVNWLGHCGGNVSCIAQLAPSLLKCLAFSSFQFSVLPKLRPPSPPSSQREDDQASVSSHHRDCMT